MKLSIFSLAAVLIIATFCSGGFVSAQSTDNSTLITQLESEIASLTAQLQAAQAQQGTTPAWCYTFNNNLGEGSTGADVSALQEALADNLQGTQAGLNIQKDTPGTYGDFTAAAVSAFQLKYKQKILTPVGLTNATGYVGAATKAELNQLYGCSAGEGNANPTPTPTSPVNTNCAPGDSYAGCLTVITNVVGGSDAASDFTLHVKFSGPLQQIELVGSPQPGSATGTTYVTDPGATYVVSEETPPSGYTVSFSGDCDATGKVIADGSQTCTLINTLASGGEPVVTNPTTTSTCTPTSAQGCLEFTQTVNNGSCPSTSGNCLSNTQINYGGSFNVPGVGTFVSGQPQLINPGSFYTTYPLIRSVVPNYTLTFSGDCETSSAGNSGVMQPIDAGNSYICNATYTYVGSGATPISANGNATLTLISNVVGGTATASNFPLSASGVSFTSGAAQSVLPGTYAVSGSNTNTNYTLSIPPTNSDGTVNACYPGGSVTLSAGDTKTCTFTYTFNSSSTTDAGTCTPTPTQGCVTIDQEVDNTNCPSTATCEPASYFNNGGNYTSGGLYFVYIPANTSNPTANPVLQGIPLHAGYPILVNAISGDWTNEYTVKPYVPNPNGTSSIDLGFNAPDSDYPNYVLSFSGACQDYPGTLSTTDYGKITPIAGSSETCIATYTYVPPSPGL